MAITGNYGEVAESIRSISDARHAKMAESAEIMGVESSDTKSYITITNRSEKNAIMIVASWDGAGNDIACTDWTGTKPLAAYAINATVTETLICEKTDPIILLTANHNIIHITTMK